jgi:hypothetical protein
MSGSSGPRPPLLDEPVSDLITLVAGEPPSPLEAGDEEGLGVSVGATRPEGFAAAGAVARARAAAAAPVGPWDASARAVEDGIAPRPAPPAEPEPPEPPAEPPPTEPPPPAEPVPPPWDAPDRWDPPPGWTVLVGWLPPAVGMVSTYWFTPEFPGGAIVRVWALAGAAASNAITTMTPQRLHTLITSWIRSWPPGADTGRRYRGTDGSRRRPPGEVEVVIGCTGSLAEF